MVLICKGKEFSLVAEFLHSFNTLVLQHWSAEIYLTLTALYVHEHSH